MKKWIIIGGSFLLLLLLAVRGLYKTVHRIDDEKSWYVSQLNMMCTLQIDSMATSKGGGGLLYCNLIRGEIDNEAEFKLNKKLHHHKQVKFLTRRSDGRYLLFLRRSNQIKAGDSLQMDSNKDQIVFYRAGEVIWKSKMSSSLRERIF